uniref:Uncharacterized protein n=1 Tax=Romanomermis culicivorax TaxID=13658 RepID=A0A915JP57_ROMCU
MKVESKKMAGTQLDALCILSDQEEKISIYYEMADAATTKQGALFGIPIRTGYRHIRGTDTFGTQISFVSII